VNFRRLFFAFFLLSSTASAQALHPQTFERLEGTVTQTVDGVSSRATLQWQMPAQLRITEQSGAGAERVIVADGDETRFLDTQSRRVRRLPFNVTKQSWRGWNLEWGGPANFALFGADEKTLAAAYQKAETAPANTRIFHARTDVGRHFVRDWVRTGGSGDFMFYAATKRWVFDRPAALVLLFDATGKMLSRREDDERGRKLNEITFTYSAAGLPLSAIVRDANNAEIARFTYELKPRAEAFPADTFALPTAPLIEDAELRRVGDYTGDDAASHFNRGVALAVQAEELPAAFAAWEDATRRAPTALAPPLATFAAALQVRDFSRAQMALNYAEKQGAPLTIVATRRAALAAALRDGDAAQTALDAAQKAQPQNLPLTLLRVNLLRTRGDFAGAQSLLVPLLSAPAPHGTAHFAAAEALAAVVSRDEAAKLLESLPTEGIAPQLARALLALSLDKSPTADTQNWPSTAVASLALVFERAGQDDAARPLWQRLSESAPQDIALEARRRLMLTHARRGEAVESLKIFKELLLWTDGEADRNALENDFLQGWAKSDRLEVLKSALQQRAVATGATEDDRRLLVAYQESFGTPADVAVALNTGLMRHPNSAWWHSKIAERKMIEASDTPSSSAERAAQAALVRDALKAADAAVAADPQQPYYAIQRTLILTQKVAQQNIVVDVHQKRLDSDAAFKALDELQAKFPGDPDVDIAVALQRLAITKDEDATRKSVILLQNALRGGLPGRDGANRHQTAFPARQMLAIALRRIDAPKSAEQFEIALQSSQNATEALGIAVNLLNLYIAQKQPQLIAPLLVRVAREPWPFSDAQQLLDGVLAVVLRLPNTVPGVLADLKAANDPYAKIVAEAIAEKLAARAKAEAMKDHPTTNATLQAEAAYRVANNEWNTTLQALVPVAEGADRIAAGRAAALLGENAANSQNFPQAVKYLEMALVAEPQDLNLRVALSNALIAANDLEKATGQRDALPRALPISYESLKQTALLSHRLKQGTEAARWMNAALNLARTSPEISAFDTKNATFLAARALLAAGQHAKAIELYNILAGPTRPLAERAAALLDAETRLRRAGFPGSDREAARFADRLKQLNLAPNQLQGLAASLQGMEM
jgi:hypothetical protein